MQSEHSLGLLHPPLATSAPQILVLPAFAFFALKRRTQQQKVEAGGFLTFSYQMVTDAREGTITSLAQYKEGPGG